MASANGGIGDEAFAGVWSAKRTQTDSLPGRLYSDSVVDGTLDALPAAKISLRCLYRNVPEQKLDLLQFASSRVTQPSTSSAERMYRRMVFVMAGGLLLSRVHIRKAQVFDTHSHAR